MFEYLFKGKRKDNGEWVEGILYKQTEYYGDPSKKYFIITSTESLDYEQALEYYEVVPESVGQYTGVDDVTGKKIFTGDMIHYEIRQSSESGQLYIDNKYNHPKVGPVIFEDQCFMPLAFCVHETIRVIGNVFD